MSDGKPASALIWSIFRPEINYFSKHSQLFPKETGEVLDTTYAQPLDAGQRQRMHQRPGGSKISVSEQVHTVAAGIHLWMVQNPPPAKSGFGSEILQK